LSMAIDSLPAAASQNGPAGAPAGTNSGSRVLPFEAILEEQTGANEETGDVGGADVPVDVLEAAALAAAAGLNPASAGSAASAAAGNRPLVRKDGTNQDSTLPGTIRKDKPAPDAAALFLLAAQDVLKPFAPLQAPPANDSGDGSSASASIRPAGDDETAPHFFAALTELEARAVLSADAEDPPSAAGTSTPVTDLLLSGSEQQASPDQTHRLDPPSSTLAIGTFAVSATLDAIRLAAGQGTLSDQDKSFNQSSLAAAFDRRNAKTGAVPVTRLADTAGSLDSALGTSAASAAAAAGPLPNDADVASSIVQTMRMQLRDGIGTAVVHLDPDYLGAVSISLRVENGVVTATMHAESSQVRGWMEANVPMLRDSLASQGLTLDHLLVTDERITEEQSRGRRQQQEEDQQARQRPRRGDAATFEVVV
jgi:flagellar hook-length control protein FliK